MYGLKPEVVLDSPEVCYNLHDYEKGVPRWCPGCGDHAVMASVLKLCEEYQLPPERTVFVSGIGCSSRFPHYMDTYGFHSLHGRAFPVACGVRFRRPDLHVFVVTGDGDCCSIGAGAWIHAIRYNMNMTVMLFDNAIYGMTKKQTSPTTMQGVASNTHPHGALLPPISPLQTTLGVANVSFVAQTADLNPVHLYATLKKAYEHPGFSFVRILQRCPVFMPEIAEEWRTRKDLFALLTHEDGIEIPQEIANTISSKVEHDPSDIHAARELAEDQEKVYLGLLYQNRNAYRYDEWGARNTGMSVDDKAIAMNRELDRYTV